MRTGQTIAILTADTHLDESSYKFGDLGVGSSRFAFKQIARRAKKYQVDLLIAGDVVENQTSRVSADTLHFLAEELKGIPRVAFLNGQHDNCISPSWPQCVRLDAEHIDQKSFMLGRFKCYGLDYCAPKVLEERLKEVPKDTDMLFCHQVWSQFMGHVTKADGDLSHIPHVRRVFTGDLHKNRVEVVERKDGTRMEVISPGCTHFRRIGEPLHHYYYELKSDFSLKRVLLRGRSMKQIRIRDLEDVDNAIRMMPEYAYGLFAANEKYRLPPNLSTPVVIIRYSVEVTNEVQRVAKAAADQGMYPVLNRASAKMKQISGSVIEKLDRPEEIIENPFSLIEGEHEQPYADFLRRLHRSADPSSTLRKLEQRLLKKFEEELL